MDNVNHPSHYTYSNFETIDVILEWNLDYLLGNCVKYISRHQFKGKPLEDLKKAQWYLNKKIEILEKQEKQ